MNYPNYPGGAQAAEGYNFADLYGRADFSKGGIIPAREYTLICTEAEFGRTRDGTKGAWTVKSRVSSGEHARHQLTTTIAVSPMTNDGEENSGGLARMYRDLTALGVPVPDPKNPAVVHNGERNNGMPFWMDGRTGQPLPPGQAEFAAASYMAGTPFRCNVIVEPYQGNDTNKMRNLKPALAGDPREIPAAPPQQPGQAPQQWAPQPGYGQPGQVPQAQAQQAWAQPQPTWQQPQQAAVPPGPQPGPPPQQAPFAPIGQQYQSQPPVQGAPGYAQPMAPGAPGTDQFTQQGMAQPGQAPPWQQPGQPVQGAPQPPWQQGGPQGQQAPQQPQGPPAQPPWQGNGAQGQVPQGQPAPQPGEPPAPPWAQ